jgi:hypothetical protein
MHTDVSEPTPAVPGRPVTPEKGAAPPATAPPPAPAAVPSLPDRTRVRNRFNQFLETTTQPLLQDNIITVVDLQKGKSPEEIPYLKTTAKVPIMKKIFKSLFKFIWCNEGLQWWMYFFKNSAKSLFKWSSLTD